MTTCLCNPYAESGPVERQPHCPVHGVQRHHSSCEEDCRAAATLIEQQAAEQRETQAGLEMWHGKFLAMAEQFLAESEKLDAAHARIAALEAERDTFKAAWKAAADQAKRAIGQMAAERVARKVLEQERDEMARISEQADLSTLRDAQELVARAQRITALEEAIRAHRVQKADDRVVILDPPPIVGWNVGDQGVPTPPSPDGGPLRNVAVELPVIGSDLLCAHCAKQFCPHGDPMHFDKDGCPACEAADADR